MFVFNAIETKGHSEKSGWKKYSRNTANPYPIPNLNRTHNWLRRLQIPVAISGVYKTTRVENELRWKYPLRAHVIPRR